MAKRQRVRSIEFSVLSFILNGLIIVSSIIPTDAIRSAARVNRFDTQTDVVGQRRVSNIEQLY